MLLSVTRPFGRFVCNCQKVKMKSEAYLSPARRAGRKGSSFFFVRQKKRRETLIQMIFFKKKKKRDIL